MASTLLTPTEMYERAKATGETHWKGALAVFTIPCDCLDCAEQYRSVDEQGGDVHCLYADEVSDTTAARLAGQPSTAIFDDLKVTRSAITSHGELINKRWQKKSNTKRKSFLKELRPDMIESENVFMDVINECPDAMSTRKYRQALLLPYLNVNSLSKDGSRMLRLVHHRIRHHPEDWVPFDNRQLLPGWHAGTFEEKFNSGCVTMFGEAYGEWKPFSRSDGTMEFLSSQTNFADSLGSPQRRFLQHPQSSSDSGSTGNLGKIPSRFCHLHACQHQVLERRRVRSEACHRHYPNTERAS